MLFDPATCGGGNGGTIGAGCGGSVIPADFFGRLFGQLDIGAIVIAVVSAGAVAAAVLYCVYMARYVGSFFSSGDINDEFAEWLSHQDAGMKRLTEREQWGYFAEWKDEGDRLLRELGENLAAAEEPIQEEHPGGFVHPSWTDVGGLTESELEELQRQKAEEMASGDTEDYSGAAWEPVQEEHPGDFVHPSWTDEGGVTDSELEELVRQKAEEMANGDTVDYSSLADPDSEDDAEDDEEDDEEGGPGSVRRLGYGR